MSLFNQKRRFGQIDKEEPELVNWCQICDLYTTDGGSYANETYWDGKVWKNSHCSSPDWPAHGKTYPEEPYRFYCPNRSLLRYYAEKTLERMGGKSGS